MAKESTIPAGGFTVREQLEKWLNSLPKQVASVLADQLASRSSLRLAVHISHAFQGVRKDANWAKVMTISVMAGNVISRIIAFYDKKSSADPISLRLAVKLVNETLILTHLDDERTPKSRRYPLSRTDIAAQSIQASLFGLSNNEPVLACLNLVALSVGPAAGNAALSFGQVTADEARSASWAAVTADARALEAGATPEEMATRPLWPEGSPYKPQFDRKTFLAAAPSFEVWIDWYEPIVDGKAPWGLPRDIANKLEERIALGDYGDDGGKAFWDRDADEVNAEIKGWVEEARAEVAALMQRPLEVEVEPQTIGALQFDGSINEPIGLKPFSIGQDWAIDEASHERHSEARRLADRVLNLCNGKHAGNNALAEFKEDFELFHASLGETLEGLNPNFVVPRGDSVRKALEAYANLEDLSKLDPLPDDVLLRANQAIAAYNQFVALDAKLALRDEALFGPDAKKRLVAPEEGQAKITNAVQTGVAKPEVLEAMAAEAKATPHVPDAENRASRRYSEGQKNFGRTAISQAITIAKVVGTSGGVLYGAAYFVWQNRLWFIDIFADNPTMTRVIGWLLHYLSKMPLA